MVLSSHPLDFQILFKIIIILNNYKMNSKKECCASTTRGFLDEEKKNRPSFLQLHAFLQVTFCLHKLTGFSSKNLWNLF